MDKTTYASDAEAARDIFSKFTAAMGSQCAFAKVLAATPVRVILEMLVEHAAFVRSRGEVLEDAEQTVVALALDLLNATDDKADLVAELEHYELPRIDSRMPTLYKFMRLLNGNGMAANRRIGPSSLPCKSVRVAASVWSRILLESLLLG